MAEQTRRTTSEDTIRLINEQVLPALSDIRGDIRVINARFDVIEKRSYNTDEIVQMLRTTLYGNGEQEKGGLITTVVKIKDWVDARSTYEKLFITTIIVELFGLIFLFIRDAVA